ncbi:MAG: hypothetical protein EBZ28_04215, partial [Alphaproteobacteria bacterium]|nr:hypothetical protein [Alphaproteobacteria bacterium]
MIYKTLQNLNYTFDESASSFDSSDEVLNQIWDFCKYSMKATSFCGYYVDGDRERIPYEADASNEDAMRDVYADLRKRWERLDV